MKGYVRLIFGASCLTLLSFSAWYFLHSWSDERQSAATPQESRNAESVSNAPKVETVGQTSATSPTPGTSGSYSVSDIDLAKDHTKVRLSAPLQPIYTAALQAADVEARSAAFRMAVLCVAKQGEVPALTKSEVAQFASIPPEEAEDSLRRREDALSRLRAFCATGNASDFLGELKKQPQPTLGPIFRSAHIFRNSQSSETQQNLQAFTQLLANPEKYPMQFDAWLDSEAFIALTKKYGLNNRQTVAAGDALLEKFIPDADLLQIRKWKHCIDQYICTEQRDNQRIQIATKDIENNIRTQRWNALSIN